MQFKTSEVLGKRFVALRVGHRDASDLISGQTPLKNRFKLSTTVQKVYRRLRYYTLRAVILRSQLLGVVLYRGRNGTIRGAFDWGLFDRMFKGDSRDIKWYQVWVLKGG